jgi:hypothetical protein
MRVAVIALFVMVAAPATADEGCRSGRSDIIELAAWAAEPGSAGTVLALQFRSSTERPVRMIEGTVLFSDVLDRPIGEVEIDPDLHIGPVGEATQESNLPSLNRLAVARPEDIRASVCVAAVVYEDGTVDRFDTDEPTSLADEVARLLNP